MSIDLFPRVSLLSGPTPLEKLTRIGAITGHPGIFVKRDDVMPLGLAGNKVRSLEFWVGEALRQGADTLLVAGKTVSNQCRLTAAAAAKTGLDCVILHNDHQPKQIEGNLLLSKIFGAEIFYLGPISEEERRIKTQEKAKALRKQGKIPYIIGDPDLAALGYVLAAKELLSQTPADIGQFDCLIIPGSMGPTEAGFLYGLISNDFAGRVYIISVEYPKQEMQHRIEKIFDGLEQKLGVATARPESIAIYNDEFLGQGYGVPTAKADEAIQVFASAEALLIEPTYTAKSFAALLDMIESGEIRTSESVCILHAGGVPSLFSSNHSTEFIKD